MYFCTKKNMNRTYILILTIFTVLISTLSCKDQKTYADYLKDETKAIDEFIIKNNFNILTKYPSNGVFGNNDFYKDPETKVYYNIIEYGDTTKSLSFREEVYVRFKGLKYFMIDDSTTYSNTEQKEPQVIEYYGPVNPNTRSYYSTPGWAVPLPRIGHNAVVKMIVPFNMGSSTERSQYMPSYYDRVEYRFESRKIDD